MNTEDLGFLKEHVSTIDGDRLERLDEVRGRIQAARRRRAAAAIGGAVAAVLAVAIAFVANPTPRAALEPAGVPGGQVIAPEPFLSNGQASQWGPRVRLANAKLPRLSRCISDPRTWGAVESRAATYRDPYADRHLRDTRMNEYLLQYADASRAHRAFLDALRQARSCANGDDPIIHRPGGVGTFGQDPTAPDGVRSLRFDEGFAQQWAEASVGLAATDRNPVLRVARADNVLVVIEDATMEDKSDVWLATAVHQALPKYRWHRALHQTTSETSEPPTS